MKRLLYVILAITLSFSIFACDSAGSKTADDMKSILEDGGYVLTQRDAESITYYQDTQINQKYDLDVTVEDLYVGYVNSTERWMELIVLSSESEAEDFQAELNIEATEGRLVYRDGSVVLITYSSETIALFVTGDKTE